MITHPVLTRLAASGVKLGLDRIEAFLDHLGAPHRCAPVVHVAGTNGKGSVCTMVTEALVAAGLRVGTNLSPHLEHVNERFRLDGVPVDDATLDAALDKLDARRAAWAADHGLPDDALTYFELATALAFVLFADAQVDVMVIEVGLGGRLDATNVVEPAVCAITSIGLDHTEVLGDTLAAIAGEKAGILAPGVPAVVGPLAPEALDVVRRCAARVGAPLWVDGQALRAEASPDGWTFTTPVGTLGPVRLAMAGDHQGHNALLAVAALQRLVQAGLVIPDAAIVAGVGRAVLAGRIERLRDDLVVDGAHNPAGAATLADWLAGQPRPARRVLLLGMGEERDPHTVTAPLLPHVDAVITTACAHPKARDAASLAARLGVLSVPVSAGGPIEVALPAAVADADEVIAAGSLYLVGAVRALVGQGALPPRADVRSRRWSDGAGSRGMDPEGDDDGSHTPRR